MATWLASRACWVGAGHDSAARHDGRVRCLAVMWRLPIGLMGQRSAAAFVGRQTRGRCDLVDRSWTRLGSEARWTKSDESQMPCSRVAIGLKGACSVQRTSTAAFVGTHSGGKPGDAATLTHAHRHLLMTIDIDGPSVQGAAGSEAELQLGSFCHSQHAFDAVWLSLAPLDGSAICSRRELHQCRGELHLTCVMHKSPCCPNLSRMLFYVALSRIVY